MQPNYATAHQISLQLDDAQLRYNDETIVRHLEFSNFGILITRPVSERNSAFSYQISREIDIKSLIYSQKRFSIWRPSAILNL